MILLQLSWFIEYAPDWLGETLVILAVGILLAEFLFRYSEGDFAPAHKYQLRRYIGWLLFAVGGAAFMKAGFEIGSTFTIISTLVVARFMEGIIAVRFYQKLTHIVTYSGFLNTADIQSVRRYLIGFTIYFFVLIAGWIVVMASLAGIINIGSERILHLYWTTVIAVISIITLTSKFWASKQDFGTYSVIGIALLITGAELHNLQSIEFVLTAYVVSVIGYSLGLWYAVFKFLADYRQQTRPIIFSRH